MGSRLRPIAQLRQLRDSHHWPTCAGPIPIGSQPRRWVGQLVTFSNVAHTQIVRNAIAAGRAVSLELRRWAPHAMLKTDRSDATPWVNNNGRATQPYS